MHERLRVLINSHFAGTTNQPSVFGHSAQTSDLTHISNVECLDAIVVENRPHFDHAVRIRSNETVVGGQTANTDQGVLMAVQLEDFS